MRKLTIPLGLIVVAIAVLLLMPACLTPHTVRFDHSTQVEAKTAAGCPTSATDQDGNKYDTVLIGEQCWYAENLRVTTYRDGATIDDELLAVIDVEKYGRLYRWAAVTNPAGLCPDGWRVPSDEDFQKLELSIGMDPEVVKETGWRGDGDESRMLKEFDVARSWTDESKAVVNQSGFSALPAGGSSGALTTADGIYGDFWTSTEHNEKRAWYRSLTWWSLHPNRNRVRRVHIDKGTGTSVRCIQAAGATP